MNRVIFLLCVIAAASLFIVLACNTNVRNNDEKQAALKTNIDGSIVKSVSDVDLSGLTSAERVAYEREHPRGFDTTGKNALESLSPMCPVTGDPFAAVWLYDADIQDTSWANVSLKERMLANGFTSSTNKDNLHQCHNALNIVATLLGRYYIDNGKLPDDGDALLVWQLDRLKAPLPEDAPQFDVDEAVTNLFVDLTSPVTGELINWDRYTFSRGNGFVTVINEDAEANKINNKVEEETAKYSSGNEDKLKQFEGIDPLRFYIRAYGETGILKCWIATQYITAEDRAKIETAKANA